MGIVIASVTLRLRVPVLIFLSCQWHRCSLWVDLRYEVIVIERSDVVGVSSVDSVIKLQNSFRSEGV